MTGAEKKRISDEIAEFYTKQPLLALYKTHLKQFISKTPECRKISVVIPQKGTVPKNLLVRLLTIIYTDEQIFKRLMESVPKSIARLFGFLVWEGRAATDDLEKKFKLKIVKKNKNLYGSPATKIESEFYYFAIHHSYSYGYHWNAKEEYALFLPALVRKTFKNFLPAPEGFELTPEFAEPNASVLFENNAQILEDLPLVTEYFHNGDLTYLKSGKPSKASIRNMRAYCNIQEFYPSRDKNLELMRTNLMLDFFTAEKPPGSGMEPLKILKNIFEQFKTGKRYSSLDSLLIHLRGRHQLNNSYKTALPVERDLVKLFIHLPENEWIDVSRLQRFAFLRDIDLRVVDFDIAQRYLYYKKKNTERAYWGDESVYIDRTLYPQIITQPLVKGACFFLAAFGLLDLAYDDPKNKTYQDGVKPYLSKFDGLKYIRLNSLGAHIFGKTKTFANARQIERASVFLDDGHLLLSLSREDRITEMFVQKFGAKIGKNRYKVDFSTFLEGCTSKKTVVGKIDLFKQRIEANPPQNWLDFFERVLNRVDPLTAKKSLAVFQLKPEKELLTLITRDPVLSKFILKAEEYHIVLNRQDVGAVKKRLEAHGYLISS